MTPVMRQGLEGETEIIDRAPAGALPGRGAGGCWRS